MNFLKEAKNAAEVMADKMLNRKKDSEKEQDLEEGTDEIMRTPANDNLGALEVDQEISVGGKRRRRRSRKSKKGGRKHKSKKRRTNKRKSKRRKTNKRKSKRRKRRR